MSLLAYFSVRNLEMHTRRVAVAIYFLPNYNKLEGTAKFIYTSSILDNKKLLSNMIVIKFIT